jgi:hypothetical protein
VAGRFYLCPVIGTGAQDDPFRAKGHDIAVANGLPHVALIPSKPDGTPKYPWCLIRAPLHTALRDDADHRLLPPLTTLWSDLPLAVQTAWQQEFSDRFGKTLIPDPGDTALDVVRALGRALHGQDFQPARMVDA